MIQEITAKGLLAHSKKPDPLFGVKYNMNLYRGCQHQCIYCDSRSECYQIKNFKDVIVKINAPQLLRRELASKRSKGTVGTGAMNDPYGPVEKDYQLLAQSLQIINEFRFPVHIITKSDLVLRDLHILQEIQQIYAAVSLTITTSNDQLAKKLEPGAPLPSARFKAMEKLAAAGIYVGVTMMPVLPFLEDQPANITDIIQRTVASGGQYILPWFGVTLRDRQRDYFYQKLDRHFPGLRQQYQRKFGSNYECLSPKKRMLENLFTKLCDENQLQTRINHYQPNPPMRQLNLFDQ